MAIPKYHEMYKSFLRSIIDGNIHPYLDVKNQVILDFNLSDVEISELLPSGKQSIFLNRIGWCRTYLKKAGLIESPSRAYFKTTETGKNIYETVDCITDATLRQFSTFVEFMGEANGQSGGERVDNPSETPEEILERVHAELNKVLRDELLIKIYDKSSSFFEHLVIKLMEKMGYGTGKVTQRSHDEGIDGIVYQDKLGFDVIYIQAKKYEPEGKVGRPLIQQFNGSIPHNGKGMFVTTARFSSEAIRYAEDKHIILIDGQKLAQLMMK